MNGPLGRESVARPGISTGSEGETGSADTPKRAKGEP